MARQSNRRQDRRSHSPLVVSMDSNNQIIRLVSVSAPPSVNLEVIGPVLTQGGQAVLEQYFASANVTRGIGSHPYAYRRDADSAREPTNGQSAQHGGFMTSGNREVGPRRQDSREGGDGRPSKDRLDEPIFSRNPVRAARASIAEETIKVICETEEYATSDGQTYQIKPLNDLMKITYFEADDGRLTSWESEPTAPYDFSATVSFENRPTILASRYWASRCNRVGVLNFASATKRGGGFKTGAEAQEESLARASNLYRGLLTDEATKFYAPNIKNDRKSFYSHGMIYSEHVTLIRDENDQWAPPLQVDMITSAAVNAGEARRKYNPRRPQDVARIEAMIEDAMLDRMGRILRLFSDRGDKVLILGSFGTGVFRNSVETIAQCWARLLGPGARFARAFEHVEFAIIGGSTLFHFRKAYSDECARMFMESTQMLNQVAGDRNTGS